MKQSFLLIIAALFVVIGIALYVFTRVQPGYDLTALEVANGLLAVLTALGFLIMRRQMKQQGAHAFVRGVYSATLLKLMVCMGSIFIYAYATKEHLHKPTIFLMLGIYFVYTFTETAVMSRQVKK